MKRFVLTFGALAWLILALAPAALAQPKALPFTFTATLSSDQLPTPVESDGTGTVIAVLTGNQLVVTGSYRDLASPVNTAVAGGANVRLAPPGEDGRSVRLEAEQATLGNGRSMALATSGGTSGTFSGVFTLTDEQRDALGDGLFYVQLYTTRNTTGELRGQLSPNQAFDVYREAYREYLAALDDPGSVRDIAAADLVGLWRDENTDDTWQIYEDGTWTYLSTMAEVGEVSSWTWEMSGPITSFEMDGQCGGRYSRFNVLYEDGRDRYINFESGPCEGVGTWRELVKLDEEGTRVPVR